MFETAGGGPRFELVLVDDKALKDAEDPFVSLNDAGRNSRVLLGRIVLGEKQTIRHLAVKVQKSLYRPGRLSVAPLNSTSTRLDRQWEEERNALRLAGGPEVVESFDLGDGAFLSPPIAFAKNLKLYFHPFCATCFRVLEDCRDDALLRDHGLPQYSGSVTRYLYCGMCAANKSAKRVLYSMIKSSDEHPKGKVEVRHGAELFADLAAALKGTLTDEQKARAEKLFPGLGDPANWTLDPKACVPLSYNECHLLPLEPLELHYDELVDLISGASWEKVRSSALKRGGPGRAILLKILDTRFTTPFQFVYRGDATGKFHNEVLRLKIAAFSQLCRGLRRVHQKTGRPHLDLNPSKVMVRLPAVSGDSPARWSFQVKLVGLGSGGRHNPQKEEHLIPDDLIVPEADLDKTYFSPLLKESQFGHQEAMRVTLAKIEAKDGRLLASGKCESDRARLEAHRPGDMIRIVPSSAVGSLQNLIVWARITKCESRSLEFSVDADEADSALKAGKPPQPFDAEVSFYKKFNVPCDLYSLGILFFRTLLVNEEQDIFAVDDAIQRVLKKLYLTFEGKKDPSSRKVTNELLLLLDREKPVFERNAVLFNVADRGRRSGIPKKLFSDLLVVGFRLLTNIPGFSFCADHADYSAEKPETVLDEIVGDLGFVATQVQVELFAGANRDREIAEVCNELITEITGTNLGVPGEEEPVELD